MSIARRKDSRGRVLKDGEVQRKNDGLYMFRWTAKMGSAIQSMMQLWRGCAKKRIKFGTTLPMESVLLKAMSL